MNSPKKITGDRSAPILSRDHIMSSYMEEVLKEQKFPSNVFSFCVDQGMVDAEFYSFFCSFEGIQLEIWNSFFKRTEEVLKKDAVYPSLSSEEKMLAFFYTFFEMLAKKRPYILFALNQNGSDLKDLRQLKSLRMNIKGFTAKLIVGKDGHETEQPEKHSVPIFSEGAWLQTLSLIKFWLKDNSAGFKNTDRAIEKSVNVLFHSFDPESIENSRDMGKLLWKEKRA